MKALVVNCTLKPSPERSNSGALAEVVAAALRDDGVVVEEVRAVDHSFPHGVETEMGEGDEWPAIHAKLLESEILVLATPTWLGRPSSVAQEVLEQMDAMISEEDDEGRPATGQAWTYWNRGPGPGDDYLDNEEGHEWSHSTGRAAAANLLAVAKALAVTPIPAPPSESG